MTFAASFELHAFLGKGNFFFCQVEGGAYFWDVGEEDEAGDADWKGDYAVDYEEPGLFLSVWHCKTFGLNTYHCHPLKPPTPPRW